MDPINLKFEFLFKNFDIVEKVMNEGFTAELGKSQV